NSFKTVYPWINCVIDVKFQALNTIPSLYSIIQSSLVPWGEFNNQSGRKYAVDLIPIYEELYSNAGTFLEETYYQFYTVHFKTFAFIFDDALFGIPDKARLEPSLLGVALRDSLDSPLTIISHDYEYTFGDNRSNPKPFHGLTQTLIHELGHQIGLMHTFQFGSVGNFIDDVMSYYTHSSQFSIFSIDNIQRGQIDILLKASRSIINQAIVSAKDKIYNKDLQNLFNSYNASYFAVLTKYQEMNYREAYSLVRKLHTSLLSFDTSLNQIKDKGKYTDMNPTFFVGMLFFLVLTVYYRGKMQVLSLNQPTRDLLDKEMVKKIELRSRERVIASKRAALEKIPYQNDKTKMKKEN
ncbi:hypothetical protein, partial [Candidatus Hodarchaeum mangrovi]